MANRFDVLTRFDVEVAVAADGRRLAADVFLPDGDGPAEGWPGVMLIHGGGWREGDRTQLAGYGHLLARAGYACAAVEYGLLPAVAWPTPLDDVQLAWDWFRSADNGLGVDASRIAVQGNSAGGHLALLVAARAENGAAAVIAVYPPTLLTMSTEPGSLHLAFLVEDAGERSEADAAALSASVSPVRQVTASFPPTQLIHGSADDLVPLEAVMVMYRALDDAGVAVDLHVHAGQPHAFDAGPLGRVTVAEMSGFLDRYV